MKKNIREYIELSAYNRAVDHLKDRGITATIREDKKIVVEQQDFERAVSTLDKAYKWGELTLQPSVTTLKEHFDLGSIVKRFPAEVKEFKHNGEMSDDLFHALYDYYFDDMPYGTKKARDGDPYEWVADRFDRDMGENDIGADESDDLLADPGMEDGDTDLEEGNGAHMFVMGDTVYHDNREGRVDRQEGNKVFVHRPNGDMDVWPADETSLTRQGAVPTMRKHIDQIGRGLKGFFTGRPELEEAKKAKNPYAVGMAQAMKSTGDEPPLKKSTIKKAHEIAKKVDTNEGAYLPAGYGDYSKGATKPDGTASAQRQADREFEKREYERKEKERKEKSVKEDMGEGAGHTATDSNIDAIKRLAGLSR